MVGSSGADPEWRPCLLSPEMNRDWISAVLEAGLWSQQVSGLNPGFAIYQEALLGDLPKPSVPHLQAGILIPMAQGFSED